MAEIGVHLHIYTFVNQQTLEHVCILNVRSLYLVEISVRAYSYSFIFIRWNRTANLIASEYTFWWLVFVYFQDTAAQMRGREALNLEVEVDSGHRSKFFLLVPVPCLFYSLNFQCYFRRFIVCICEVPTFDFYAGCLLTNSGINFLNYLFLI